MVYSATLHYKERMGRIALFDPLYILRNKTKKDNQGKPIDYYGIGLITLLYFFENMLLRNKKTGSQELADFLQGLNRGEMDLTPEGYLQLARDIIDVFRPSGGKKNSREFYNWETRAEDEVIYSILKTTEYDSVLNKQYYTLDEQGLELVFATKEFFSEFQLSINQLILRKQLEKGEFIGALRQIDEMRINVESLRERMTQIHSEIQRSIVSDKTYERYKNILEDINLRLKREHEEFEELKSFVKETKVRLGYEFSGEKERKTYELVLKIDYELGEVHDTHNRLLTESIELKSTALQAAKESLYYTGIQSFNFEHEIVQKVVATPLPVDICRILVKPFLPMEEFQEWSLLSIFSPQRIEKGEESEKTRTFAQIEEEENKTNIHILSHNFGYIMGEIIKSLDGRTEITLLEVVNDLKNREPKLLEHRSFYDFWLIGHQYSPIRYATEENTIFNQALEQLPKEVSALQIQELSEMKQITPRYAIQNMVLRLQGNKSKSKTEEM